MIRFFDFIFSLAGLIAGFPARVILYIVGLFDTGKPLFLQKRVGRNQKPFTLVKFRTMTVGAAQVATNECNATNRIYWQTDCTQAYAG